MQSLPTTHLLLLLPSSLRPHMYRVGFQVASSAFVFRFSSATGISSSQSVYSLRRLIVWMMKIHTWGVTLLVLVLLGALAQSIESHGRLIFNVESFGARGDGVTDSTEALLVAWTAGCNEEQSAIVFVPNGTFLIKPITFHGPCRANFSLRVDGTLIAPDKPQSWGTVRSWLTFTDLKHFTLRGRGTFLGRGQQWWNASCSFVNNKRICTRMPASLRFEDSKHIKVKGVTILESPHFHLQFLNCNHVTALSLQIMAPPTSPQTDGIHVERTRNAHILNTTIGTGDDCVSVGEGSVNVTIRGLMCGPGHGISIGSLGKRYSRATVKNILVDGATLTGTKNGVRIKTWQGGHGWARKIAFRNIKMINVSNPIVIDQHYCDSPRPCANNTSAVRISNITFEGIEGTSRTDVAVRLACSEYVPCKHILLREVSLKPSEEEGMVSSYCHNAQGQAKGEVIPPSCLSLS